MYIIPFVRNEWNCCVHLYLLKVFFLLLLFLKIHFAYLTTHFDFEICNVFYSLAMKVKTNLGFSYIIVFCWCCCCAMCVVLKILTRYLFKCPVLLNIFACVVYTSRFDSAYKCEWNNFIWSLLNVIYFLRAM